MSMVESTARELRTHAEPPTVTKKTVRVQRDHLGRVLGIALWLGPDIAGEIAGGDETVTLEVEVESDGREIRLRRIK